MNLDRTNLETAATRTLALAASLLLSCSSDSDPVDLTPRDAGAIVRDAGDENECEVDSDCADGTFCNGDERCDEGRCVAGTAPDCDDGVACTLDECGSADDACVHRPSHAECPFASTPFCDADSGCVEMPCMGNADCDDDVYCNGAEVCEIPQGRTLGTCAPGGAPSCDDTVPCTVDRCAMAADACTHTPDHASCSDDVFCNGAEVCDPVLGCGAGASLQLDDGIPCTEDFCNESMDEIVHAPHDPICSDGEFCNGAEVCSTLTGCIAGTPPVLDDQIPCTMDACDETTDTVVHAPNHTICDDGTFCNGAETCNPVMGCQTASSPCSANVCSVGCNETIGCFYTADRTFTWNSADCTGGTYGNQFQLCDGTIDLGAGGYFCDVDRTLGIRARATAGPLPNTGGWVLSGCSTINTGCPGGFVLHCCNP